MNGKWRVYDPDADTERTTRNLPHWDQSGSITFVTLRLADSMPRQVVLRWHQEIDQWMVGQGLPGRLAADIANDPQVSLQLKNDLKRFRNRRWHGHLDDCHGRCPMREPTVANIVAESFLYFDGLRYDLERFVVMPNHAHLLIQMRDGFAL